MSTGTDKSQTRAVRNPRFGQVVRTIWSLCQLQFAKALAYAVVVLVAMAAQPVAKVFVHNEYISLYICMLVAGLVLSLGTWAHRRSGNVSAAR